MIHFHFLCLLLLGLGTAINGQQGTQCSAVNACLEGCCSKYGSCGFGPDFCGAGCQGTCNAIAQCGQYSNVTTCPLNVCCSQYGFCGTTASFCGTGCQNGCAPPPGLTEFLDKSVPSCTSNTNATALERRIAYYELFGLSRPCDTMQPEAIAAGALTHINLAFILFDSTFNIIDTQGDIVARVSRLKMTYPGLRVNAAIGGWAFNDPPTQFYFSNMASTYPNRQTFINSVMSYLQKYGLDGIDIDWEYPAAADRGGVPADTENFVLLVSELQEAFARTNPGWEVTITLPSSYWYLRGFDLPGLQKYISWFNFMSYDLHGMWDQFNQYTGPYLLGHTNLTQVDEGLDLLWRNQIDPKNVVLGFGFYGRSFTMSDPSCYGPTCTFSAAGVAGDCSQTAGILIYAEIVASNQSLNVQTFYDPVSTVKFNVYNGNQWISYDDQQSFTDKKAFLTSRCLSGAMIWAIDQDDAKYDALTGLLGEEAMQGSLLQGGDLSDGQKEGLASQFSAYTGQDCLVTEVCTDGSPGQRSQQQVCPSGTSAVSTAHSPLQAPGHTIKEACSEGWYRSICCPTKAMPKNCQWNGAPIRSAIGCTGFCGPDQFKLNTDTYVDAAGHGECYQGERTLCCDNTQILSQCFWTSCQGPLAGFPECPSGSQFMTSRYDDGRETCASTRGAADNTRNSFSQAYCCPTAAVPTNCSWTFEPNTPTGTGIVLFNPEATCIPSSCWKTQVQYTTALDPPNPFNGTGSLENIDCNAYPPPPGQDPAWPYCCNPPEAYNEKWPVDPSYLWQNYYDKPGDSVEWAYTDNFGNNAIETQPGNGDGSDPYGFVMLDGPPGSLSNSFASDFTIARRSAQIPNIKRSLITTNRTLIDTAFDHSEETIYVYCNFQKDSPRCKKIFFQGAEDTIIRLPDHVGEGPFARIVSMELADDNYVLPAHHLRKRSAQGNDNEVYKVVFDYNFHLIKRQTEPVNMRVDYTNLLSYWKDVTDTPARKRSVSEEHLSYRDWRSKVGAAKEEHTKLRKRQRDILTSSQPFEEGELHETSELSKRWWGTFLGWLQKLNTIESSNIGYLNMAIKKSVLLYRAMIGCPRTNAQLSIYLDTEVAMDSTYAYYFSGTIVPPAITGTYAYFGLDPSIYLGLTVTGSARMQYTSQRQPLIPTLSYPGLAIKGIAAVGPTLDIFGQIIGIVQISGTMQVGARYNFEKAEVYWPQDTDSAGYAKIQDLIKDPEPTEQGIVPQFQAAVAASADLNILVTPEAHIGIQVGGSGTFGTTLVDAQLVGYVNSTLQFHADATGTASTGGASLAYNYGVYLLYNLGYGGYAHIPFYTWSITPQNLFSTPKKVTLYSNGDVISTNSKRDIDLSKREFNFSETGVLNSLHGDELSPAGQVVMASRVVSVEDDIVWSSPSETANFSTKTTPMLGLMRRADGGDAQMQDAGQSPDFSLAQQFTCPNSQCSTPGGGGNPSLAPCPSVLPDFRYNCNIFRDTQANGPAGTTIVPGICTNVQGWFNRRSLTANGLTLTYDSVNSGPRREFACGRGTYCAATNILYATQIGISTGISISSCDEFPFASTEEGGGYFGTLPTNPTTVGAKCVPVFQQNIQGACNQMLGTLSTNVAYADDPNAAPNWQVWGGGGANSNPAWLQVNPNGGFNRLAEYPTIIPQAAGISDAQYTINRNYGYMFKRNFTMGLSQPSSPGDGAAWGAQAASSYTFVSSGPSGTFTDATTIACAVNIFGQNQIYRYGTYNGWCLNPGTTNNSPGYGNTPSFSQCQILFSGPTPSKRDKVVGSFNGWDIERIVMEENPAVVIPAPDFMLDGPMTPVEILKT